MTVTMNRVNGIDVGALRGLIDDVTREPKKAVAGFAVTTRWTGGTKTETRAEEWTLGGERKGRGFTVRTDEPPELCGEGVQANPQEVLMAGLNACMMVGYVAGCAARGIELEKLEIETEGELDLRGFLGVDPNVKPGYEELRYTVRIKGNGTPEQFREVHETVMRTSPNFFNLSRPVVMRPRLEVE